MAYGFSELLREQLLELYSEFFPNSIKRDGGKNEMAFHECYFFNFILQLQFTFNIILY